MPTQGPARFGKKRAPNCECTYSYTCGPCLAQAGPTLGPPSRRPCFVLILEDGSKEFYCSRACRAEAIRRAEAIPFKGGAMETATEPMPFAIRPHLNCACYACGELI